jgi:hypothetical protein
MGASSRSGREASSGCHLATTCYKTSTINDKILKDMLKYMSEHIRFSSSVIIAIIHLSTITRSNSWHDAAFCHVDAKPGGLP